VNADDHIHNRNFEKQFCKTFNDKTLIDENNNLTVKIVQLETSRFAREAVVDLYLEDADGECISIVHYIQKIIEEDSDYETGKYDDCNQINGDEDYSEVKIVGSVF
jgi:hypothetical protein